MRRDIPKEIVARKLDALMNAREDLSSQQKVAKRTGIGQTTVGRIRRGEVNVTLEKLNALAGAFGVTVGFLCGEEDQEVSKERRLHDDIPGAFRANHNRFRKIPAYGKAMGGLPERIWDDDGGYPVGASDVYAEVASADPNAFLVPIEGTSMIPRFNPGEFGLVEPNTEPELEDDVLVRLKDGRTMLKRLLSRRGGIRFGSYNDPEIITAEADDIRWMYYVAHPVPAKKIKNRI